ncbi:hypothetical protein BABINDRAFT_162238 [Babjeviella inositovora NRRL Y-12698]|uniref:Exocyst complex protein EXO70 n=1 Tax=Babjeviella inositovora NRRL Y-12698 TaxID=984486 RepID=A0A1E3QNI0_9ASCO|nr:uncharacterized protein BABINDRAFT_162238 [Babjeviella inositovora NRRL Y-12698]ODQ79198.1 hypothetical protein BABINDRAFT_162238 [Babjeviella inositovora NRRL Y-12698]
MDIDEADITVLEEHLLTTSALVRSITLTLNTVSAKFSQSRTNLKPVISSTKALIAQKKDIAAGLETLAAVDESIQRISALEAVLELPLSATGLRKYIDTLARSRLVLLETGNLGAFKGVTSHFKSVVHAADKKLDQSFRETMASVSAPYDPAIEPFPLASTAAIKDLKILIAHKTWDRVEKDVVDARREFLRASLQHIEAGARARDAPDVHATRALGVKQYTTSFCEMVTAEHHFLWALLGDTRADWVFGVVCDAPLRTFLNIVAQNAEFAMTNKATDGLMLFDLIDALSAALEAHTRIDAHLDAVGKLEIEHNRIVTQAHDLFKEMFRYVDSRVASVLQMPSDNGVCPVIVEIMSRLRKFSKFSGAACEIIVSMPLGSWIPSPKPQWVGVFSSVLTHVSIDETSGPDMLSCYFSDLIDAMLIALELRCKALVPKLNRATMGYFLITNLTLIEQIAKNSEMDQILGANGNERLEKLRKRFLNYFLDGWKSVASILMDVTVISGNDTGKMSSKEKDVIRDKFKMFNAAIEELIKQHKSYNITDKGLRQFLQKEINFVSPLYRRFYDKYGVMDWVRKGKNVKWDKEEFDGMLEGLQ